MAEWIHYFNLTTAFGGLMAALMGILLTLTAPYVERWERRFFLALFSLLSAFIACDLLEQTAQYFMGSDFMWLAQAGVFFELLLSVAIVPTFTAYLLRCTGENLRTSPLFRTAIALYVIYVVVIVVAQFSDAVYYLSVKEQCVLPGPFYPALIIPPIALMVLNLVALARRWSVLTHRLRIAFAVCTAVPLVCVFLQAAFFGVNVLVIGSSLSALILLVLVMTDQMKAHVRQREEAAQRQSQVMALQMRPHFIYNVMTSIYYLCAQDPERAQQVTLDFTDYLRANFAAVAAEADIPFAKELEHTRAYLAVEGARFEDNLVVDIDCPHTAFHLPPLTLQPLVENAVKHGADPEKPPLHVRIATRKDPEFSVVTVEDTGPGFDYSILTSEAQKDDTDKLLLSDGVADWTTNPTSALTNIRERLAARGSTLDFASRKKGGTVATIRVPLGKRDD